MSDTKHIDLKAECLNLQNILDDLIHLKGESLTKEEKRALLTAKDWLGDISNPLTPAEQKEWDAGIQEFDELEQLDPSELANDADRREWINYLKELD